MMCVCALLFFSSRRRHTRCALVTGVQTCALPILSPADGRVVAVEETQDVYADRQALKISVFMNVFNVHSNRSPVNGTVAGLTYFPGKFFNASLEKASSENERNAMVIDTAQGYQVTSVPVAGLVAKRSLCYFKSGDSLYGGK